MVFRSKAVKKTALAILKNNWPGAIIAAVIPLAFFLVFINILSLLSTVFSSDAFFFLTLSIALLFIGIPLILGVLRYFWGLCIEAPISLAEIFLYFSSPQKYKKAITFIALLFGKLFLQSLVLLLPSIIIDIVSKFSGFIFLDESTPIWFSNLWIFSLVLRVVATFIIVYIVSRYYLAFFMFVSQDELGSLEIMQKSYAISRFFEGNFISLIASMLGWILLSIFFVPLVFTLPYIFMCYMVHSRYSAVNYNLKLKGVKGE